jgi:Mg2+ and Co2+ transporter CorA
MSKPKIKFTKKSLKWRIEGLEKQVTELQMLLYARDREIKDLLEIKSHSEYIQGQLNSVNDRIRLVIEILSGNAKSSSKSEVLMDLFRQDIAERRKYDKR